MNTLTTIALLAVIGALIGWITNTIAIKLMFRPIEPIKIPLINKEIIGLIPKRKADIATNIGQVVAEELLSIDDIIANSVTAEDKQHLNESIKNKIRMIVAEKINFIPGMFRGMAQGYIDNIIEQELDAVLENMATEGVNKIKEKIDIQQIVQDKINDFDLYQLERIIINIAKQELKHIEILGGILGGIIGIVQGLIVCLL